MTSFEHIPLKIIVQMIPCMRIRLCDFAHIILRKKQHNTSYQFKLDLLNLLPSFPHLIINSIYVPHISFLIDNFFFSKHTSVDGKIVLSLKLSCNQLLHR